MIEQMNKQTEMMGIRLLTVKDSYYKHGVGEVQDEPGCVGLQLVIWNRERDSYVCVYVFWILKLKGAGSNNVPVAINTSTAQIL